MPAARCIMWPLCASSKILVRGAADGRRCNSPAQSIQRRKRRRAFAARRLSRRPSQRPRRCSCGANARPMTRLAPRLLFSVVLLAINLAAGAILFAIDLPRAPARSACRRCLAVRMVLLVDALLAVLDRGPPGRQSSCRCECRWQCGPAGSRGAGPPRYCHSAPCWRCACPGKSSGSDGSAGG